LTATARIPALFVAPFGELGGSEMVMLRVIRALDERFAPRALILAPGPLAGRLEEAGVPTTVVDLPGKQALARMPAVALREARRLRPEGIAFIHANQAKAALLGILLKRRMGVPLVWMKHDHVFDGRVSRAIATGCDRVVCVSRAMTEQFGPRLAGRVTVAYPGVSIPAEVSPVPSAPHIVSVGRLDPAKGLVELLDAVALLRSQGLDVRVSIAGPPDRVHAGHGDELRALASRIGPSARVEIGWVDDVGELFNSASVVALASRARPNGAPSEGAPTLLMEAMAHARPVVAPREAGIAEVVGDAGTLVDERTGAGFAAALEPLLRDRRYADELGARGRERASRLFSFERTVETLTGLYQELAGLSAGVSTRPGGPGRP
jgi:glycosyltransferase involved in cell wall biosynthesis